MKKMAVVVMAIAVLFSATKIFAQENAINVQFWGYPTEDGLYNVGISGTANFKYSKIEYISGIGSIIRTVYQPEEVDGNPAGVSFTDYNTSSFFGNIKLESRARAIISVRVYDQDGNYVPSRLFERTPSKWVFEIWNIQPAVVNNNKSNIIVTYVIHEVFGNVIEDGRTLQIEVGDHMYPSSVYTVDGKKFCSISILRNDFIYTIMGKNMVTVFLLENETVLSERMEYPEKIWKRPEYMNLPATR